MATVRSSFQKNSVAILVLILTTHCHGGQRRSGPTLESSHIQRRRDVPSDDFMPFQWMVEVRKRKSLRAETGRSREKYRSRAYTHTHYRKVERLEQTHLHQEDYEREIYSQHPEEAEFVTKHSYYSPFPSPSFRVNRQFRKWVMGPVGIKDHLNGVWKNTK